MDCRQLTNDRLLDFSERLMDGPERKEVETHLASCRACRVRHDEIRSIATAIRKTLHAPTHTALAEQLEASLLNQTSTPSLTTAGFVRRRMAWVAWVSVAAVLAIALLIGLAWNRGRAQGTELVRDHPAPLPPVDHTSQPLPPPLPLPPLPVPVVPEPIQTPEPPSVAVTPAPEPTEVEAPAKPEVLTPVAKEPQQPEAPRVEVPVKKPVEEPARPPQVTIVRGDFNQNGKRDRSDFEYLDQQIREGRLLSLETADLVEGNGVDCGDALALLQAAEENP